MTKHWLRLLAAGAVVLTASCSVTEPVVVIGANGQTLRGTATAAFSGGYFSVTDGQLTCKGTYDSWSFSETIEMPVLCSDGRKGIVIATRDPSGLSGHGIVRMNDGTRADFIFGAAAKNF